MEFSNYLTSLHGKTVAVLGTGVSNTPLIERLCAEGIAVTVRDKKTREQLGALAERLEQMGATLICGEEYLENLTEQVIFRTPGLRPDLPQMLVAQENGSELTSEMELFFRLCPVPILAVTGSDGKTTTTSLIAEMLRHSGRRVFVGGNIGHPLLCEVEQMKEGDAVVLELSSFQLQTMQQSPQIAVVTNLAPNHLDWHQDMAEYVTAKEQLIAHQCAEDLAIFNWDNADTRAMGQKAKGRVRWFSRQEAVSDGVYCEGKTLYIAREGISHPILNTKDILLPGVHNIENYMAAICALMDEVDDTAIVETARTFGGVEHRIELVRQCRGVRWYNDSIASNPTRCIAGLRSFSEKVVLIAGGYDKHIPFTPLAPEIVYHVKHLILCGATAQQIETAVKDCPQYQEGAPEIVHAQTLTQAVELANAYATDGDVVLFSPACASFDQFRDFVERGRYFKTLVQELEA